MTEVFGIVTSLIFSFSYLKKQRSITEKSYLVTSLLFVLYLSVVVVMIVGFPSLSEFVRLYGLGKPIFNANLLLIPFSQGVDISTFLNIVVFIPLGIFLPLLGKRLERAMPTLLLAVAISLTIELGQLFTLYRLTDINDLIMNVLGIMLGWLIYGAFIKPLGSTANSGNNEWLVLILATFVCCFLFG